MPSTCSRSAPRKVIVDVVALDRPDGKHGRDGQHRSGDEDGAISEQVAHARDQKRTCHIAGGIEGLVFPELAIEEGDADDPHRDCGECRPKEWPSSSNQDLRRVHRPWSGSDTEQNRSQSEDGRGENEDQPLRPELIDDGASRSLQDNRDDAADGQRHPDPPRLPSRSSQVRREKRTEAGLHIGEKEVRRFKSVDALLLLRCDGGFGFHSPFSEIGAGRYFPSHRLRTAATNVFSLRSYQMQFRTLTGPALAFGCPSAGGVWGTRHLLPVETGEIGH